MKEVLRVHWLALLSGLLGAAALGLTACGGGDDGSGDRGSSGTVVVYSSLPLQGAARAQGTAMANGIELAVEQASNEAGGPKVKYISLDDSGDRTRAWTPKATSANAHRVAADDAAVAYIGELDSVASAISIPILNKAPIAQVSPANTAVGLTTDEPGAGKGEPDRFYPTGKRHYVRIVPTDTVQGAALATVMKQDGCRGTYILNDGQVYGAGLARNVELAAKEQGLRITGDEGIDTEASSFRSQAGTIKRSGADCILFSGVAANGVVRLYEEVSTAVPGAKLYGPDGVAEPGFVDPEQGGIPAGVATKVKLSMARLSPDQYPPAGQRFFADYKRKYGDDDPDPAAIYGYEAMKLVLDTCGMLGDQCGDRRKLIDALFTTKSRKSVLGTYDIDEHGDTTLANYGIYTIKDGELVFGETVKARRPEIP